MSADFVTLRMDAARARLSSDLVLADGWGFVAGVLPIDLDDDKVALPEQVEAQTRKVLANLARIVAARGLGRQHVMSLKIYLVDLPRLEERMEQGLAGFFPPDMRPAISVIGVAHLPRGALVAMDCVLRAV